MVLQGKHPIIVEYAKDLVPAQNVCLSNASFLRDVLEYHKVPTYLEHTIREIKDKTVVIASKDGKNVFADPTDPRGLSKEASASFPHLSAARARTSTASATVSPSATCVPLSGAHGTSA